MHFGTKSYLKNNHKHTTKQTQIVELEGFLITFY
jgi:hypothetical protein